MAQPAPRSGTRGAPVLELNGIQARDRTGLKHVTVDRLRVLAGEIVGVAGISGNGQMEMMEILTGQRPYQSGEIHVNGTPYAARRDEAQHHNIRVLPEEPLQNACAPRMSVSENIAFRSFDTDGGFWLSRHKMRARARDLVQQFKVKTTSIEAPISALSGGNVQRAVLARELSGKVDLLIISNPCFGLDFSAVSEIRARIMQARNAGTAVLILSEDLDEIMELTDRVLVMSGGAITYDADTATADIATIGAHMGGHA